MSTAATGSPETTGNAPETGGGLTRWPRFVVVSLLIAALLGLAGALLPGIAGSPPFLPALPLPWWAMALAFLATETFVLNIQAHRETQTISISELPLVVGLFFATPVALLVGRIVAAAILMISWRRRPPLKIAFNLALLAAETALAIALFSALAPDTGSTGPATWLAAYAAAVGADLLGALSLACVIAAYDGGVNVRSLLTSAGSQAVPVMGATLGLICVTSLAESPTAAWLLVAAVALALLGFRSYASLAERHLNLERLYRFSRAVSTAPKEGDIVVSVLAEAKDLLRCEVATVCYLTPGDDVMARVDLGRSGAVTRTQRVPGPEDAWIIDQVVGAGVPLLVARNTRDPRERLWLDTFGLREAILVPLSGGDGMVGALVVADRLGDVRTFEADDVLLLETVSNHAGVALRNDELIGRLRYEALHDSLTGLPNRTYLQRALAAALDEVASGTVPGATVMVVDLDEFKEVNDTLGHHQGDALLVEVGARLTTAVGAAGTVARLGGDEFAVLLPSTADENRVVQLGRRVLRSLEEPIALDGLEVEIGASVGIALAPAHADNPSSLLKRADLAMYDAKSSTRRLRLYEPDLHATSPRRLTLVSELRAALHDGGIEVHVQPKAELRSGDVVAAEALVRWKHPELGWVAPDEFVPVAERSGLIGLLTTRVLDASLAACASWRAAGSDLGIAVNLSTRSLQDADLVDEVARLLLRHDVPADRLTLEVTESSVMADPTRAVALLHQLRELGVRLSVDDFGTGYSSLSYLQRLPVQEVKIDRSFVSALCTGGENVAIVRAIVDLGRHLGLDVVAEGVEDQPTWDLLTSMNCDLVQGWHLARAMPTDQFLGWLAGHDRAAARAGLRIV
ncbi:MAG: putative Diguanylate cyclase/phosphodiesterase [Blastococcus sp.]|nr:putative Diguanylate cyclase/phosphodiesterase [Blastococcus sp.]